MIQCYKTSTLQNIRLLEIFYVIKQIDRHSQQSQPIENVKWQCQQFINCQAHIIRFISIAPLQVTHRNWFVAWMLFQIKSTAVAAKATNSNHIVQALLTPSVSSLNEHVFHIRFQFQLKWCDTCHTRFACCAWNTTKTQLLPLINMFPSEAKFIRSFGQIQLLCLQCNILAHTHKRTFYTSSPYTES